MNEFKPKEYKRQHGSGFEVSAVTGDDLHDLLKMTSDRLKNEGLAKYTNDDAGLQDFRAASIGYLDFLREQNDNGGGLTPTVESWCAYAGISRTTLHKYERRSESWNEFISYFKNLLMACKTELAAKGKMPHVVYIFDATNNGAHYYNTSEFRISTARSEFEDESALHQDAATLAAKYRAKIADGEVSLDRDVLSGEKAALIESDNSGTI